MDMDKDIVYRYWWKLIEVDAYRLMLMDIDWLIDWENINDMPFPTVFEYVWPLLVCLSFL